MAKSQAHGNREAKKPKKLKPKVIAAAPPAVRIGTHAANELSSKRLAQQKSVQRKGLIMSTLIAVWGAALMIGQTNPIKGAPSALFPNNIDCGDFQKTGATTWSLHGRTDIDLCNWDGGMRIHGSIILGKFIKGGADLHDVLERRCLITHRAFSAARMQAL